jgi:hypothetical protein
MNARAVIEAESPKQFILRNSKSGAKILKDHGYSQRYPGKGNYYKTIRWKNLAITINVSQEIDFVIVKSYDLLTNRGSLSRYIGKCSRVSSQFEDALEEFEYDCTFYLRRTSLDVMGNYFSLALKKFAKAMGVDE